jgi:hypothetical protein
MRNFLGKPLNVFLILFIFLTLFFFLIPINLFDGEIVFENGLQKIIQKRPLSLAFVTGMEYDRSQLKGIKDFYLLPQGYVMVFIFIFCIPAIAAYRVHLGKPKNENKTE